MDEVVVAEDVRKRYGDVTALDGVSLAVAGGEVFGLIGPNGAGKTTLVRALTGTTRVDGSVRLFGRSPTAVDPARVGLLPQSFSPAGRLTARELLTYYAGLYDESRDVDRVLADVGLAEAADTWYERLSGGQQRRVCVGTALVNDPDVLFLDEPTTGIDPAGRRRLWDLLSELAAGGTTVFLTSHSMQEVERLSDRVGLLADGRLVAVDAPETLIERHGGESRVVVGTDADPGVVSGTPFELSAGAGELVFHGVDATDVGEIVALLGERGVDYDSLVWTQPDLEDVYLSLTGESFEASYRPGASAVAGPDSPDGGTTDGGGPDGAASGEAVGNGETTAAEGGAR